MFVKLPPIVVSSQSVPALYASIPGDRSNSKFMVPGGVDAPTEVESASPQLGGPLPHQTPQTIWHERATMSRAYAKILLNGGSLG
jgi:hypothetical protein